jgi:hypothetical protein
MTDSPESAHPIQQAPPFGTVNSLDSSSSTIIISSTSSKLTTRPPPPENFIQKHKSWLLWWNLEEWWACWIGFVFFGIVCGCVNHNISQPEFLPWRTNPFDTFATPGNYGLLVLFPVMGLLVWLGLASIQAPNWSRFPIGYILVFFIALISKILASNGKYKGLLALL